MSSMPISQPSIIDPIRTNNQLSLFTKDNQKQKRTGLQHRHVRRALSRWRGSLSQTADLESQRLDPIEQTGPPLLLSGTSFPREIHVSDSTYSTEITSSVSESTSEGSGPSDEVVSTTSTNSTIDPALSLTALTTFETQGIFVRPHIEQRFTNMFKEEFKTRLKTNLSRICGRTSWQLQFSMAGLRAESLTPSILVWCEEKDCKARARKYIEEDPWLTERLCTLGWGYYLLNKTCFLSAAEVAVHQQYLCQMAGASLIASKLTLTSCGLDILLPGGKVSKVGGLITVDAVPYLQTTRHGVDDLLRRRDKFGPSSKCPGATVSEIASSSTQCLSASTEVTIASSAIIKPKDTLDSKDMVYDAAILYPPFNTGDPEILEWPADDLDWMLVDLSDASTELLDRTLRPNLAQGTTIDSIVLPEELDQSPVRVSVAGLEPRSGVLQGADSMIQIEGSLYEVSLVTFDTPLQKGVSGTWVTIGNRVLGFIIAVRDDLPWAYVIPMHDAIEDIKKKLRANDVRVPTAIEVHDLRERFISRESINVDQAEVPRLDPPVALDSTSHASRDLATASAGSKHKYSKISIELPGVWKPGVENTFVHAQSPRPEIVRNVRTIPVSTAFKVQNAIQEKMQRNWENKQFISNQDLTALLDEETVAALVNEDKSLNEKLRSSPDSKKATFIRQIGKDELRLLALCIYLDTPLACLYLLLMEVLDDLSLPLSMDHCPSPVYRTKWEQMMEVQGSFEALSFLRATRFQDQIVHPDIVLPFILDEPQSAFVESSFTRTHHIKIDRAHHCFSNDQNAVFALKSFNLRDSFSARAYMREICAYKQLQISPHPHIVEHLASWTQGQRAFLLMPTASSNLEEYMESQSSPILTVETTVWFLSQLRGLTSALLAIYNDPFLDMRTEHDADRDCPWFTIGYHHDIKPTNILVFDGEDTAKPTFKISDFGNAELLQTNRSRLATQDSHSLQISPTYGAPEAYQPGILSKRSDIWSLGCVFTEALTWLCGSLCSGLGTFALQRLREMSSAKGRPNKSFWYIDKNGDANLKPVIVHHLSVLGEYVSGEPGLQGLSETIEGMLVTDPTERPDVSDLCCKLDQLVAQAGGDDSKTIEPNLLERSSEERSNWRRHRSANSTPVEGMEGNHGKKQRFGDSTDDHENVWLIDRADQSFKSKTTTAKETSENIFLEYLKGFPDLKTMETLTLGLQKRDIDGAISRQPLRKTVMCQFCNDQPQGFHGDHELRRHFERHHSQIRRVWICRDASESGTFLSGCKACHNRKTYGANYNAAAHLRRAHFSPRRNRRGGDAEKSEGRGGMGGGNMPSMEFLKHWMYEALEMDVNGRIVTQDIVPNSTYSDAQLKKAMDGNLGPLDWGADSLSNNSAPGILDPYYDYSVDWWDG